MIALAASKVFGLAGDKGKECWNHGKATSVSASHYDTVLFTRQYEADEAFCQLRVGSQFCLWISSVRISRGSSVEVLLRNLKSLPSSRLGKTAGEPDSKKGRHAEEGGRHSRALQYEKLDLMLGYSRLQSVHASSKKGKLILSNC
jgi:hypothetical protein